ncbi:actin family [Gaertneriomyces semiglobifer]|nr:actin family [Gaertneriomyces semiglobifer]
MILQPVDSKLIVLETGSLNTKCGYVDHTQPPEVVIPTVAGRRLRKRQAPSLDLSIVDDLPSAPQTAPASPMRVTEEPQSTGDESIKAEDNGGLVGAEAEGEPEFETVYYCGQQLKDELSSAGGNDDESWKGVVQPIENGIVTDWEATAALWKQILMRELQKPIKRARNNWALMLAVPLTWSKDDYMRATQIVFEELNMLAFAIIEQPLTALYGCNLQTGLVIDIGHETTDITPILENLIIREAAKTIPIGGKHIEEVLLNMLREDEQFVAALGDKALDLELARHIKQEHAEVKPDTIVVTPNPKDVITVKINDKEVPLGPARYGCTNVLFDPTAYGYRSLSIAEAVYLSVSTACDPVSRPSLWENIVVTGGCCHLRGIKQRLENEFANMIAASETSNEYQSKDIRWRDIPDYILSYKERPGDAGFLGANIVAKLMFISNGGFVHKNDYSEVGPMSIHLKQ